MGGAGPWNGTDFGIDYFNRTATARSNMSENRSGETRYFHTDDDGSGQPMNGSKTYAITFAAGREPPVNGFCR